VDDLARQPLKHRCYEAPTVMPTAMHSVWMVAPDVVVSCFKAMARGFQIESALAAEAARPAAFEVPDGPGLLFTNTQAARASAAAFDALLHAPATNMNARPASSTPALLLPSEVNP
jgi:hypothetical protein